MHDDTTTESGAVRERDRGLVRMRRLRRVAAAGAAALVLGFGTLAIGASQKIHNAATASTTGSTSTGSTTTSGSSEDDSSRLTATQTGAPQSTSQSPSVTSGGS